MADPPLRILFASPAYWPAHAFGGPVSASQELVRRLVAHGHSVDVLTTSLLDLSRRPAHATTSREVDGARVTYLATPLRYRWMGITPSLPLHLRRLPRPDVVHVFGFRDPVTTMTARWARHHRIPFVFEPLGMLLPRLRKVGLKKVFDRTVGRAVVAKAAAVVVSSEHEAADVAACGVPPNRIVVRGNGFPVAPTNLAAADLSRLIAVRDDPPVVLYVGRIAAGKGIEHLLAAARRLPDIHVVLVGPDDRHGTHDVVMDAQSASKTAGRVHLLPPTDGPPFDLYAAADVVVLPSARESFGLAAAEAAAVGTSVIVTDRCGVAGFFRAGEALVVPYDEDAVVGAIDAVVTDPNLRDRLSSGGRAAAARQSWDHVADLQQQIYRGVIAPRGADTSAATMRS